MVAVVAMVAVVGLRQGEAGKGGKEEAGKGPWWWKEGGS